MCVLTQPDLPTAMSGPGEAMCAETQHQNKTNRSEGTCLSIQGSAQPHRAQGGLLSRWGKSHIPLKWASLGWKKRVSSPDDPWPHLYLCRGEPWSRVFCLPARIPGSRVGVARQAHHSTLGCFAFGVKRAPQMSRHCHSGNLSPQEFQRWAVPGASCYPMSELATYEYFNKSCDLLSVFCFSHTVWDFNIGWKSYVSEFRSQACDFSILHRQHDVHILLAGSWELRRAWHVLANCSLAPENQASARRWREKLSSETCFFL